MGFLIGLYRVLMAPEGLVHGADLLMDPEMYVSRRDLLFQKAERERPVAFTAVTARLEARDVAANGIQGRPRLADQPQSAIVVTRIVPLARPAVDFPFHHITSARKGRAITSRITCFAS